MSVTANLRSSATRSPALARCTSSNRSPSVPNAVSATPIVTTGRSTVSTMAAISRARMVTRAPSQPRQGGVWCAQRAALRDPRPRADRPARLPARAALPRLGGPAQRRARADRAAVVVPAGLHDQPARLRGAADLARGAGLVQEVGTPVDGR